MIPTLPFVQEKYDAFNKLCFGGTLPPVPIRMSRAGSYFGKVVRRVTKTRFGKPVAYSYQMFISARFDYPQAEVEDTIIHEMVHYWMYVNDIRDTSSHGPLFRAKMNEINEHYGRHITVSHKAERADGTADGANQPGTPDANGEPKQIVMLPKKPSPHIVCLLRLTDGAEMVTVVARTRILALHRDFSRSRQVQSFSWFYTTDPWFDRFPAVRTAKAYPASAEVTQHLASAMALECDGRSVRMKK